MSVDPDPLWVLVGFGRELRRRGLPAGTGRVVTFCRAASAFDPLTRDDLYWAGRASMVSRREDVESFDEAFKAYFVDDAGVRLPTVLPRPSEAEIRHTAADEAAGDLRFEEDSTAASRRSAMEDEEPEGEAAVRIVASDSEVLRTKSFADLSDEERIRTDRLIRKLAVRVPRQRARRLRPAARGTNLDLRRTLRRSLRTYGEPLDRAWHERSTRYRPLVLLLDVSGSMAPYSRALLQFAYAAMVAGRRVEVFCFGTRLTRITRTLATRDPDRALRELGRRVEDWEGGTRIGASLKELLDAWSQRAALRGAVVVLCSDGLERGDPALLGTQMARLRRLAHKVVWVNPLKGSPRYEPLARGMAAALPSVDVFLPGHDLESLEALGRVLGA